MARERTRYTPPHKSISEINMTAWQIRNAGELSISWQCLADKSLNNIMYIDTKATYQLRDCVKGIATCIY